MKSCDEDFGQQKRKRIRKGWIVTVLACLVALCTAYGLIIPAITLENAGCEIPEHSHTQLCYTQVTTTEENKPDCNVQTQNSHQHTEECYDTDENLQCGSVDSVVHQNDTVCRDTEENLCCTLPEIKAHIHDDSCSIDQPELSCTLPEDENHTHTDHCYGTWELTCGLEAHTHTADCVTSSPEEESNPTVSEEASDSTDLTNQLLTATIYTDSTYANIVDAQLNQDSGMTVTVSGLLPEGAEVRAYPVNPDHAELTDVSILCAYDITVFTADGAVFQPDEEAPLNVTFHLPQELETEETTTVGAAHLTDDGELERIASTVADNTVSFAANHFSIYVAYQTTGKTEIVPGESVVDDSAFHALRKNGYFTHWEQVIAGMESAPSEMNTNANTSMSRLGASPYASRSNTSASQITASGGSVSSEYGDNVSVSKTIAGTDIENVFDITLKVNTTTNISEFYQEPDVAVVIVMDISNTMRETFGNVSRYEAAMDSAELFMDTLSGASNGVSKLGFVAFNTDAHEIFGLSSCANEAQAVNLKNILRTKTGDIIDADDYPVSHYRYTNIEAGLQRGYDMLKNAKNRHKFIIFLSDGFPTTYIKDGYTGYDPWMSGNLYYSEAHLTNPANIDNPEVFCDRADTSNPNYPNGKYCLYSVSYSDTGAIRARQKAEEIKKNGIEIFAVGVDIGGQSIKKYDTHTASTEFFSVIQRTSFDSYEIGSYEDEAAYRNWMGNSIGSGFENYYFDSTDQTGMENAYREIFKKIQQTHQEAASAQWVTTDPMGTNPYENIEFIGFFNKNGTLVPDYGALNGSWSDGGENTASVNETRDAFTWNLKASGYTTTTTDSSTMYHYSITYRVRLKNERKGFIERDSYNTNNTTTLTYQTFTLISGNNGSEVTFGPLREIEFPIPAVKGYLSELTFQKQGSDGNLLKDAQFTLAHDTEHCMICHGNGTSVALSSMSAKSGEDGMVTFADIPSGHVYTLEETVVPPGHMTNADTYSVNVAYDVITVTVTHPDGTQETWREDTTDHIIVNETLYRLPETGGAGTQMYAFVGLMLTAATGYTFVYCQTKRKK